ncbi:MAG TPA: PAS domain S-box protein [Acidobacteriota bacterium]|nr:PAS domain S-box protein [Acidobacteriota bacterium]
MHSQKMKGEGKRPPIVTEPLLLIAVALGAFYWVIDTLMYVVGSNEANFLNPLLGLGTQQIWQRLIVLCFFVIFASHVQFTIKKRRNAEAALQETEERYREMVETSTDTIISVNEKMEIIQWNRAASELFGFSKDLVMGKLVDILIPEQYRQRHIEGVNRFLATGEARLIGRTIELEGRLRDGTTRPIELSLSASNKGGSWTFTAIIRETTERRRALQALRESEQRYRNLFEDSRDAIMIWTGEGKILAVNQASLDIFGYTIEGMIGADIADMYVKADELTKFQQKLEQEGAVRGHELKLKKRDGTELDCLLTATVRKGKDGSTLGYQGIARDVTDQKRNENELKRTLETLRKAMNGTIQAMSLAVESRDPYTAGHQKRVSDLARAIAQEMGLSQEHVDGIRMSGLIHDLGKISIPAEILTNPSHLSEKAFELIKDHPQVGYNILREIEFPWPVAQIVLQHHERMDGSGYPKGLSGDEIRVEARVLAVADVVEAMASHRPYRPSLGLEPALEEISRLRGTAYDPAVVDACLRIFREKGYQIK